MQYCRCIFINSIFNLIHLLVIVQIGYKKGAIFQINVDFSSTCKKTFSADSRQQCIVESFPHGLY